MTIPIGTLTAGSSDVETIVVSPTAAAVPSTVNTVTVTGDNFDPNSLSTTPTNTATTTTAVAPSADLLVQLNQSAPSALVGQNLTYTIDVTNFGPSNASGVVLTDTLPANTTVVSATSTVGAAPQVNAAGTSLTANISALPNGQTAVITVVIMPQTGAVPSITNSVSVTSATTDPNTVNNSASLTTQVAADADLLLTVVPSATSVQVGQNLTYTYTVVNNGPNDATTAALTDPLPTGMSFVSGTVTVAGVVAAAPTAGRRQRGRQPRHRDQRLDRHGDDRPVARRGRAPLDRERGHRHQCARQPESDRWHGDRHHARDGPGRCGRDDHRPHRHRARGPGRDVHDQRHQQRS